MHVIGVDKLIPRIREELLRHLEASALFSQVVLFFSSENGSEAFQQYRLEVDSHRIPNYRSYQEVALEISTLNQCLINVTVVSGCCGQGKSRFIFDKCSQKGIYFRFVVHEGFTVEMVIKQLVDVAKRPTNIYLHFDVTEYGNKLDLFNRFIYHLLINNLFIDEESGKSLAVLPDMRIELFIELPVVDVGKHQFPPTSTQIVNVNEELQLDNSWSCKDHPYLRILTSIETMVATANYISVRKTHPYIMDESCHWATAYLQLRAEYISQPTKLSPKIVASRDFRIQISEENRRQLLENFFLSFSISQSKRVRSNIVRQLSDRCQYLIAIANRVELSTRTINGFRHQSSLTIQLSKSGSFFKLMELFIEEIVFLCSETFEIPTTSIYTIRPPVNGNLDEFDVILITSDHESERFKRLKDLYSGCHSYRRDVLPGQSDEWYRQQHLETLRNNQIRGIIAPAFGINNTTHIGRSLESGRHILTTNSLNRLLYLNTKRSIRSSMIEQGETVITII